MSRMRLVSTSRRWRRGVRPAVPAEAAEPVAGAIIVSLTGNDTTGDGSVGNPYRTPTKAVAEVAPGGTIYFRGGKYETVGTDVYLWGYPGASLEFSGTEAAPITVSSYPGEWAIFDGKNHTSHPRYLNDNKFPGGDVDLLRFIGAWVTWENMEFRNSVGYGFHVTATDCTFRNIIYRRNNQSGLYSQSARCLWEDNVAVDNYSLASGGNSGDGFTNWNGSQIANEFPGEVAGATTWRRNIANHNADDGYDIGNLKDSLYEYNISLNNGVGPSGNGQGFKCGLASTTATNNIYRYNVSAHNRSNGFDTNTSQGVLIHNNAALGNNVGYLFTTHAIGACDNDGFNNLAMDGRTTDANSKARIVGQSGCSGDPTTHTHNAGSPEAWLDGTYGTDNMQLSEAQLDVLSRDITHADFLRLSATSDARNAGVVVHQASDVDLGPTPYGEDFAGGWDWQAVIAQYPSAGANLTTTEFVDGADREVMVLL